MAQPRYIESGGRLISLETTEGKELSKWEQPYVYRPYPKMMYKAQHLPGSGRFATAADQPAYYGFRDGAEWDRACQAAESFTRSCQKIVNDEKEHKDALNSREGWRNTPQEAVEFAEARWKTEGNEAGERNYRDRNMSDKAKAESEAAEKAHFGHLPEIPEKKRRGRARKSDAAA
jgi:hypothetical protein